MPTYHNAEQRLRPVETLNPFRNAQIGSEFQKRQKAQLTGFAPSGEALREPLDEYLAQERNRVDTKISLQRRLKPSVLSCPPSLQTAATCGTRGRQEPISPEYSIAFNSSEMRPLSSSLSWVRQLPAGLSGSHREDEMLIRWECHSGSADLQKI